MLSERDKCIWVSPTGVAHFVREKQLRTLATDESLNFDKLAKHCHLKPLGRGETKRPPFVHGWQLGRKANWLQRGEHFVCIAPPIASQADAKNFVEMINSSLLHPLRGVFNECEVTDLKRLTHLARNHWVWSNSQKVSHLHGWNLVDAPEPLEQYLPQVQPPSPYTFPVRCARACGSLAHRCRRRARAV